ncbi:hypothetical protein CXP34_13430 [Ralstonia mannitolilytica]|nr:hypothetical protein CXP34_13430 [Ralstonia mannitolilytica]
MAILLVSASYGIGFVFGTGELARTVGMASSLYAAATGIGMLFLAVAAGTFWRLGTPIWGLFRGKNAALESGVALLSSVWLLGIFSVQLQGAAAVLGLNFGLTPVWQYAIAGLLVWGWGGCAGAAGAVFSVFLAAASASLVVVIVLNNGIGLYGRSLALLATDAARYLSVSDIGVTMLSTIALVVLGADYQQFVILARSQRAAVLGCVLAGVLVMLISTLPSTAVLAAMQAGHLPDGLAAKETIPFLVVEPFGGSHTGVGKGILCALLLAALGSGAAVAMAAAHAMRQALSWHRAPDGVVSLAVVLGGIGIAQIGTSMVGLIVSINTLFLATVAVPLVATLLGYGGGRSTAWAMGASFVSALTMLCESPLLGWHASAWVSALVGIAWGALVLVGVALYEARADVASAA